jgi:hypothetical protein
MKFRSIFDDELGCEDLAELLLDDDFFSRSYV